MFIQKFGLECTEPELRLIRRLAELIGMRAARLSACGVAAICKKKDIQVLFYDVQLIAGMFCRRRRVGVHQVPPLWSPPCSGIARNLRGRKGTENCNERGRRWKRVRYQLVLR
jgi:hypothetical protein